MRIGIARPSIVSSARVPLRLAFFAGISACCLATAAQAAEQCWGSGDLTAAAREANVNQSTVRALVDPPQMPFGAAPESPYPWTGALRRVELPAGQKYVALTFDLCEQPHEVAGYQGDIVDYLRKEGVRATFFAGGKWLLTHSVRAQQLMADDLFEVGNHTWEHRNLRILNGSQLDDEILNTNLAYQKVRGQLLKRQCLGRTGKHMAGSQTPPNMTLFRFPFGACDEKSLRAVEDAGLRAIQWDVSSGDPSRSLSPGAMVRDVVHNVRPGSIVLFHANGRGWQTGKAIPHIIQELRAKGYQFVTVGELLGLPGAHPVTEQRCYDSHPGDTNKYDALARTLTVKHGRAVARLRAQLPREARRRGEESSVGPRSESGAPAGASGPSEAKSKSSGPVEAGGQVDASGPVDAESEAGAPAGASGPSTRSQAKAKTIEDLLTHPLQ